MVLRPVILFIMTALMGGSVLCGCEMPWVIEFDKKTFDEEWAKWKAQNITDYTVVSMHTLPIVPGNDYNVRIVVQDNEIVLKEDLGETSQYYLDGNGVLTISELYSLINDAYQDREGTRGKKIEVTYNKKYHFPEYVEIYHKQKPGPIAPGAGWSIIKRLSEIKPLTAEKSGGNNEN